MRVRIPLDTPKIFYIKVFIYLVLHFIYVHPKFNDIIALEITLCNSKKK